MASIGTGKPFWKNMLSVLTAKTETQIIKSLVLWQKSSWSIWVLEGHAKEMNLFIQNSFHLLIFVTDMKTLENCPWQQEHRNHIPVPPALWPPILWLWPHLVTYTLSLPSPSLFSQLLFGASEHLLSQHQVQAGTSLGSIQGAALLFIFSGYSQPTFPVQIKV